MPESRLVPQDLNASTPLLTDNVRWTANVLPTVMACGPLRARGACNRTWVRLLAAALVWAAVPAASPAYIPPDENEYWDAAFPGLESPGPVVETVVGDGVRLYIIGTFTDVAGVAANNVAAWDGLEWSACGAGLEGMLFSVASARAGFYVGGHVSAAGGTPIRNVARWDGKRWLDLAGGVNGGVLALEANGGSLYVGGSMTEAGGVRVGKVARWDGSRWWPLGVGIIPVLVQGEWVGQVSCFAFDGSNVFVGGYFRNAGGVVTRNVARWDGAQWHELGKGLRGHDRAGEYDLATVEALQWHQGKLYAAGSFRLAGEVAATNIACWDGGRWQGLGSGVNLGGAVFKLASNSRDLFAAGVFKSIGGVEAFGLARWDGAAWHALGSTVGYPGGLYCEGTRLYVAVGDLLRLADGRQIPSVAVWNLPRTLKVERAAETVRVSWPEADWALALEAAESPASTNWQPVVQDPGFLDGRWTVTEAASGSGRFYRLRSPE